VLKLRRGTVVSDDPLTVEVDGERRPAWADGGLVGETRVGDEVVVNTEARDLGLGSGGFDIVHVNLTRGVQGGGTREAHTMKLNYTSLQHAVEPVESQDDSDTDRAAVRSVPVLAIPLHGHLAPAAWAAAQAVPGLRVGYIQTAGGALPGSMSQVVQDLRARELLAGHLAVAPSYGAEHEASSLVGALDAAAGRLSYQAVIAGPGPGILGTASRYGHGGMVALDVAHGALALGLPALVCPRLSAADPRPRHRGLSHHTAAVLRLLLSPVQVPVPEVETEGWPTGERGVVGGEAPLDALREACADRHDLLVEPVDLAGYAASGLPTQTMGRSIKDDPLFFAAALAGGRALAEAAGLGRSDEG
jgi:uncharacterized protein DUF3866